MRICSNEVVIYEYKEQVPEVHKEQVSHAYNMISNSHGLIGILILVNNKLPCLIN